MAHKAIKHSITEFKAGSWEKNFQFNSFLPNEINTEWIVDDPALVKLLSEANIRLGELNAFSMLVPDVDFFIKMHVSKEAVKSSHIEGTQTNMEEALQKEEDISPEKRNDWLQVHNYTQAMNASITGLSDLPLSNRMLRNAHSLLMQGARGSEKAPGDFRTSQNWIGGASIRDAVFIPPHQDRVPELMSDLEKFLHNDQISTPDLIKIGIAHYQFETIYPFLDGNGRIGRLLITLYLMHCNILVKPTLYLSDFFEKNKSLYYDNLMRARTHNNLLQWLKFFVEGVKQTSENSIDTFKNIISMRTHVEKVILGLGKKSMLAKNLLEFLYVSPIADSPEIAAHLGVNITTANRLIADFIRLGILVETTGYKRNRLFAFEQYLSLFR